MPSVPNPPPVGLRVVPDAPGPVAGGQKFQEVTAAAPMPTYQGRDQREMFRALEESLRTGRDAVAAARRMAEPFWATSAEDEPFWARR